MFINTVAMIRPHSVQLAASISSCKYVRSAVAYSIESCKKRGSRIDGRERREGEVAEEEEACASGGLERTGVVEGDEEVGVVEGGVVIPSDKPGTSGISELVERARDGGMRGSFLANGVLAAIECGEVGGNEWMWGIGEGNGIAPRGEAVGEVLLELGVEGMEIIEDGMDGNRSGLGM